ncbi:5-oxoprolinase subunit B family protein [Cyclobacterium jeungdonense]|uniref:Allophanate hydrolase subunit 1 n=1 Tax=Cyclobacterium jeungdonense TaxID=708087 RepID=A0ABT8CCP7_9BACT|nr:allophanate hydrolase subunit 1 [Cyclobacterium jeungdonense]MDN3690281.1 allophanate hydrolase subunit 1 [Cyclobacterium jeungdonense]
MNHPVQIIAISSDILEIHWPEKISEGILFEILAIKGIINEKWAGKILRMCQGYQVLGIQLATGQDATTCISELKSVLEETLQSGFIPSGFRTWKLPVCYDLKLVPELEGYLKKKSIGLEDFIEIHTENSYRLYFYGFLPGFMYLGGLEKKLHIPRKATPDRKIPAGSVAIGGSQTGVYPMDSPGGWYVVGRTPVSFFSEGGLRVPFRPGDAIRFESISLPYFKELKRKENFSWKKWEENG